MARKKDPELGRRLVAACWEVLVDGGYDALTFAKVAATAGAHRTDVYRRWSTKAQLVVEALAEHLPEVSEIDTGDLRSDLRHFVGDLAASWSMPWMDSVVALLADMRGDAPAEEAFLAMTRRRGQVAVNALYRAKERGEISELPSLSLLGGMVEGPLMHRRMFGRTAMGPAEIDVIVDSVYRQLLEGKVRR